MIVTTTEQVAGKRIVRTIGLVRGNTIRARSVGRDILAGLKNLVGGEISEYTKMIAECREEALDRMMAQAQANGANAVVGMRFASAEMMEHAAELLAYGTAVVVEDL
ncbi:YbjQ family protein [bacterium]|nr:YbjQ family protein [bacterium]